MRVGAGLLLFAALAGCLGEGPTPTDNTGEGPPPATGPGLLDWSTDANLGSVGLEFSIEPQAAGECTFTVTYTGFREESLPDYYIFFENATQEAFTWGNAISPEHGHVHAGPVDTRPTTWAAFSAFGNATGIKGSEEPLMHEGNPFRVWLFFPSIALSAPEFSPKSLDLSLECEAGDRLVRVRGGRELVAFSQYTHTAGASANAEILASANLDDGFDADFTAPGVEFLMFSYHDEGTAELKRPGGSSQFQLRAADGPHEPFRASDGPGHYSFRTTRVGVLDYTVGVLGGLHEIGTLDELASLPRLPR